MATGVVFLLGQGVTGYRYASAAADMRSAATARFTELYPGTPIVDLERQMRSRTAASSGSDFLLLTATLNAALAQQEGTTLTNISYDEDGELSAELTLASFAELEALASALRQRGLSVREGSDARREDGAFVTRLYVRAT
jgi:type II secretory pathway component PulL